MGFCLPFIDSITLLKFSNTSRVYILKISIVRVPECKSKEYQTVCIGDKRSISFVKRYRVYSIYESSETKTDTTREIEFTENGKGFVCICVCVCLCHRKQSGVIMEQWRE